MGDTPDQDTDSAAMLDAFRNQPVDVDADTRGQMGAVADASTAADELFRARTDS
jgi:hypothetical protein